MTLTELDAAERQEQTDAQCIVRSRFVPDAFAAVFDRHWSALHAFCTARLGAAGEDIAAEVFRAAFDQRHRYDADYADARPWLYGIATNLIREHLRSRTRRERALALASELLNRPAPAGGPLDRIEARELGPELTAALGSLRDDDRDTFLLLAWADLDYEQISAALAIPVGTVRSRIHRARRIIRKHLNEEMD